MGFFPNSNSPVCWFSHHTQIFLKPTAARKPALRIRKTNRPVNVPLLKLKPGVTLEVYELSEPANRVVLLGLWRVFCGNTMVCGHKWDRICKKRNNLDQITSTTRKKARQAFRQARELVYIKFPQLFSLYSNWLTHIHSFTNVA